MTVENILIISIAVLVAGYLFLSKRLNQSSAWNATITPLASIMGSGFLICAPMLYTTVGNYAVFAMAGLLALAYLIGSVIRFNIQYLEPILAKDQIKPKNTEQDHSLHFAHRFTVALRWHSNPLRGIERLSNITLIGAYCISVSYYLQLLAHFAFHNFGWQTAFSDKILVTAILASIGLIGLLRGLQGIEKIERIAVNVNLSLILSLIAGLVFFNLSALTSGEWSLSPLPVSTDHDHNLRILMGLLIVVQGFETSRFLGSEHSATERIRTMRNAQIISSAIYISFVGLMAFVIGQSDMRNMDADVTAIISLSALVASVLPLMISVAAIGSQFSAATADDAGCSGLIQNLIKRKSGLRIEYIIVSILAITLTWLTDIFEIISFASRAFAAYYMLQCLVAVMVAWKTKRSHAMNLRLIGFGILMMVCGAVVLFGIPAG